MLRDIHRTTLPKHDNVRRIGVDDWAFRKGVDYGSIIIDLDTGHTIDLLGDREHDSFKSWLDEHFFQNLPFSLHAYTILPFSPDGYCVSRFRKPTQSLHDAYIINVNVNLFTVYSYALTGKRSYE